MMKAETLTAIFERDLLKLKEEISLYKDENNLWVLQPGISNSTGNLCLHLIGNLKHFIGAALGHTGFIRERELEFSLKNIKRTELIAEIESTITIVKTSLAALSDADFDKDFPFLKHGDVVSTGQMLLHLITHLSYHLGQINYHRRLLDV